MFFFRKLFKNIKLKEIFTPTKNAKLTYINRDIVEDDLNRYLSIPGKQIFIYGHSGSGKTTLLRKKVFEKKINFITTPCRSDTTFEDLLLDAFDKLNTYYIKERSFVVENSISSELKSEIANIGSIIKQQKSFSESRVVPYQINPQKLAHILGKTKTIWVIEDFHKLSEVHKKVVADTIKIFMDEANDYDDCKVICIGAVGSARELIELDNNLNNRVAELEVPLLNDNQIKKIIQKGFGILNIRMDDDLIEKIVYYSNNLASVTHQICYDICYDNNILVNKFFTRRLNENSFYNAVSSYVRKNSDTFTKIYDKILCKRFGWNILKVFEINEKDSLGFEEILSSIPKEKTPNIDELKEYLTTLCSLEYKEIIRYDRDSEKYSLSSPFFKAYLKMKLALERTEIKMQKRKKIKKRNHDFDIINDKGLILNEKNIEIYYKFLVKQIESKNRERVIVNKTKNIIVEQTS